MFILESDSDKELPGHPWYHMPSQKSISATGSSSHGQGVLIMLDTLCCPSWRLFVYFISPNLFTFIFEDCNDEGEEFIREGLENSRKAIQQRSC